MDQADEPRLGLTHYVFHLFAVVSRHREALLEARLKGFGLSLSRYRALSVIVGIEPCTMSELADFTAVDRTTLTRTVDQLVEAGLVERAARREDRRQVLLVTTAVGGELCRQAIRAIFEVNHELTTRVSEDDKRHAARMLEALLAVLVPDEKTRERLQLRDDRTAGWAGRQPGE